jgi:hypothetical protein
MTPEAPEQAARCMPRYVLSVARNVKCPLSLEKAGQCIVVNATARIGQPVESNPLQLNQKGAGTKPSPRRFGNRRTQCVLEVCLHAR